MAIARSDFGTRVTTTRAGSGVDVRASAVDMGSAPGTEGGGAPREILAGDQSGELQRLTDSLNSPEANRILKAFETLQGIGKYIGDARQKSGEAVAVQDRGARETVQTTIGTPASVQSLTGQQTPAPSVNDSPVRQGESADEVLSREFASAGGGFDGGEPRAAALAATPNSDGVETSYSGGNPGVNRAADVERRISEARRDAVNRAAAAQNELRALLEQALGVMETLVDQSPVARLDDLKRRVAVLEQRANNDRSHARY